MTKPLSIALLGTRGIPARYGGFETFAEELSTRLVERGHKVTVFGRRFFGNEGSTLSATFQGVSLRYAWTVAHKYLETPIHAFTSNLQLLWGGFDVALLCNAANSPFAWMINLLGIPVAINVDGIERERKKWNALGRLWYRLGERTSVAFGNKIIGDAQVICDYYRERYGLEAVMIPYGASATMRNPGPTLEKFQLTKDNYILYVSRLEPENNALGVIQAYLQSGVSAPLVIVGDAPYADAYKVTLREAAKNCERVIFTGYQFGEAYQELQSNCLFYIQATEVGGTHPALIEAMAYGNCVLANGTPENKEVVGESGLFYSKNNFDELSQLINSAAADSAMRMDYKIKARERAIKVYSWDAVTNAYEKLFSELYSSSNGAA